MNIEPQHTTDEALDKRTALEQRCGIKVEHVLAISSVLQALPTCLARGSIRRRALPAAATGPDKFAVHHLIPIVFAPHDILWRVRDWWDQNDPSVNGVALPISRLQSLACGLPFHAGSHPRYSGWVGEALDAMARHRDQIGWPSVNLVPVLTHYVSQVRAAVIAIPPGSSVDGCKPVTWLAAAP